MSISVSVPPALAYGSEDGIPAMPAGHDVELAAFNTVRNYARRVPGGVDALADRVGMNRNTLLHKTNPDNTTHHLSLKEAVRVQRETADYSILHAMANALGHTATKATPDQAGGDPVEAFMRLQAAHADLVRALADAVLDGEGAVTPNQMRRVDAMAQEAIATVGHAMAMLRGRMRPVPERAP